MSALKGLVLHGGLLVLAAVLAIVVWTRDEKPVAERASRSRSGPARPTRFSASSSKATSAA